MDNKEFAERIYALRTEKGISQKELGELLGVSNKAVSKWENGESMPKTATLLKIADEFNIDISELMGAEAKEKEQTHDSSGELSSLKAENAQLRSQLIQSDKKKKLGTAIAVVICTVIIAMSGVFAFFTGNTNADNKTAVGAGVEGSTVDFAGKTFELMTPLDKLFYPTDTYFQDNKEAVLKAPDGSRSRVLINCSSHYDVIQIAQNSSKYHYIANDKHIKFDEKNTESLVLDYNKTVAKSRDNYFDEYIGDATFYSNATFYSKYENEAKIIGTFIDFYNSKKETADSRAVELYLGNKGCTVEINLNEEYNYRSADIGEFFKGGDGKMYFYDYTDTKAYDVGKEMAQYVKGD